MAEKMNVYGKLFAGGQMYSLLNPQPVERDNCWQDGTYAFFVANSRGEATQVVTNSFVVEYAAKPESMLVTRVVSEDENALSFIEALLDQPGDDFMDEDHTWVEQEPPLDEDEIDYDFSEFDDLYVDEGQDDYSPDFGRQDREPLA